MNNTQRSQILIKAANECLEHARSSLKRQAWNMVIRRSQETVELALASMLARIAIHYPKDHDQAPILFNVLDAHEIPTKEYRQKIETISADLARKRGPALHQEEGYDQETAKKALLEAQYVLDTLPIIEKQVISKETNV